MLENGVPTAPNPPAPDRREAKLSPEGVYDLRDQAGRMHVTAATRNTLSVRARLERTSDGPWQSRATAHEGGHPNDLAPAPYRHYNIRIVRKRRTRRRRVRPGVLYA